MMPLPMPERVWCIAGDVLPGMFSIMARSQALNVPISRPAPVPMRSTGAGRIALIELVGPLGKYPDFMLELFGGTAMLEAAAKIRIAAADPSIGSIVLYVDSPGGTAAGTDVLCNAIFEARQVKPVIGVVSDMAASGAYWAVSQATKIYANAQALVGSIGCYIVFVDWSKAFADQGVQVDVIRSAEFKGAGTLGTALTAQQRAELQNRVDSLHRFFVSAVARGRRLPPDKVRGFSDGRVFAAAEAQRLGLIDEIGTLDDAIRPLLANLEQRDRIAADRERQRLADIQAAEAAAKAEAAARTEAFARSRRESEERGRQERLARHRESMERLNSSGGGVKNGRKR